MTKVVRREGVESEVRRIRAASKLEIAKFPSRNKFLEDHYPEVWNRVRNCRMGPPKTWADGTGRIKVMPIGCSQHPFCHQCMKNKQHQRVKSALDAFNRCTPKGKQPRFLHGVQTAPTRDDTHPGAQWGRQASEDPTTFARIVFDTSKEHWGQGIGGLYTYQDFGERAFAKRHPHIDFTLNGWEVQDGQAVPTPRLELRGGGRQRWDQSLAARATVFHIGAEPGNFDVSGTIVGNAPYYRVLAYQLRELVDLRKIEYSRQSQTVHWLSYRENSRQRHTTLQFKEGLREYQQRLGVWGSEAGSQELHRAFGHMAKRSIGKTEDLVGGAPIKHGKTCPCAVCGDWEQVYLDEVDRALKRNRNVSWDPDLNPAP